jgi:GNAT superfamily N-acetyltransferase
MLTAFRDGILVGLLEFDRVDETRTMVWKLYVDPDAQGRGIGGLLLERLLQSATTPEVRVEHDARNAAAGAFFEGFGFPVDEVVDEGGEVRTVRRVRRLRPATAST